MKDGTYLLNLKCGHQVPAGKANANDMPEAYCDICEQWVLFANHDDQVVEDGDGAFIVVDRRAE